MCIISTITSPMTTRHRPAAAGKRALLLDSIAKFNRMNTFIRIQRVIQIVLAALRQEIEGSLSILGQIVKVVKGDKPVKQDFLWLFRPIRSERPNDAPPVFIPALIQKCKIPIPPLDTPTPAAVLLFRDELPTHKVSKMPDKIRFPIRRQGACFSITHNA